jgi:hypothetical protein
MDNGSFDRLTRHTASEISRRTTLMALGAAGLSALTGTVVAEAKGGKKKNKNRQNNQPAPLECPPAPVDRCLAQADECTTVITGACAGDPACTAKAVCCSLLETCNATAFFACL